MDTLIKIIVGVVIGALGFWGLQSATGTNDEKTREHLLSQEEKLQPNPIKHSIDISKDSNSKALSSEEKGELELTQAELARTEQQLAQLQEQLKRVATSKDIKGSDISSAFATSEDESKNSYLSDIPEDYHQLLDPPERRKGLPELHKDFVNEGQDMNWGGCDGAANF